VGGLVAVPAGCVPDAVALGVVPPGLGGLGVWFTEFMIVVCPADPDPLVGEVVPAELDGAALAVEVDVPETSLPDELPLVPVGVTPLAPVVPDGSLPALDVAPVPPVWGSVNAVSVLVPVAPPSGATGSAMRARGL